MDTLTPAQRSRLMSRVRREDTALELALRRALWAAGLRYRVKNRLPGRPDVVFPGKKVAVFVDGCFWHGCPEHGTWPKTNVEFWEKKIRVNRERDVRANQQLRDKGWIVIRIWGHEVAKSLEDCVAKVRVALSR